MRLCIKELADFTNRNTSLEVIWSTSSTTIPLAIPLLGVCLLDLSEGQLSQRHTLKSLLAASPCLMLFCNSWNLTHCVLRFGVRAPEDQVGSKRAKGGGNQPCEARASEEPNFLESIYNNNTRLKRTMQGTECKSSVLRPMDFSMHRGGRTFSHHYKKKKKKREIQNRETLVWVTDSKNCEVSIRQTFPLKEKKNIFFK